MFDYLLLFVMIIYYCFLFLDNLQHKINHYVLHNILLLLNHLEHYLVYLLGLFLDMYNLYTYLLLQLLFYQQLMYLVLILVYLFLQLKYFDSIYGIRYLFMSYIN